MMGWGPGELHFGNCKRISQHFAAFYSISQHFAAIRSIEGRSHPFYLPNAS
jgi:hypothetical protein